MNGRAEKGSADEADRAAQRYHQKNLQKNTDQKSAADTLYKIIHALNVSREDLIQKTALFLQGACRFLLEPWATAFFEWDGLSVRSGSKKHGVQMKQTKF